MATRLLCKDGALLVCSRGLQSLQKGAPLANMSISPKVRTYSSTRTDEDDLATTEPLELGDKVVAMSLGTTAPPCPAVAAVAHRDEPPSSWLNIMAGIFSPGHMSLPGSVGDTGKLGLPEMLRRRAMNSTMKVVAPLPALTTLGRAVASTPSKHAEQRKALLTLPRVIREDEAVPEEQVLECQAQTCPKLMRRDVFSLLPAWAGHEGDIVALTLSQRTEHDMSWWSEGGEAERGYLEERFIETAMSICTTLKEAGFKADFIDPTCGRPYYGTYTNDTMFETDERYRHLGFTIEDHGCCKVLTHKRFGSNVFVGVIFTTAPVDDDALVTAVCYVNDD